MFGLPETILKLLKEYFTSQPQIIKVFIYGSRAMGREHPGSDIDLAILTSCDEDISGRIQADLEDLPTPYLFDVLDYQKISNPSLRDHIDRIGKIFFEKN